MVLEYVNRREFHEGFPILLSAMLGLLGAGTALTLVPFVRDLRARNNLLRRPITLVLSVVLVILLARLWVGIVIDQMPCVLGVPLSD